MQQLGFVQIHTAAGRVGDCRESPNQRNVAAHGRLQDSPGRVGKPALYGIDGKSQPERRAAALRDQHAPVHERGRDFPRRPRSPVPGFSTQRSSSGNRSQNFSCSQRAYSAVAGDRGGSRSSSISFCTWMCASASCWRSRLRGSFEKSFASARSMSRGWVSWPSISLDDHAGFRAGCIPLTLRHKQLSTQPYVPLFVPPKHGRRMADAGGLQ